MSSPGFQEHLNTLRHEVETALAASLAQAAWPESLKSAVDYSLMASGKRLRPILVLLACDVCGGERETALPAACAIEMIHTYSLIHDDLPAMDNDDLRRGRPTSHIVFGEALAILAGDCLLTSAFETLANSVTEPQVTAALLAVLSRAAGGAGMVGGQILDLEAERGPFPLPADAGSPPGSGARVQSDSSESSARLRSRAGKESADEMERLSAAVSADSSSVPVPPEGQFSEIGSNCESAIRVDQLTQIHTMKTGALIAAALEMGAVCARASEEDRRRLHQYGLRIGLAFQIADDLLDITGSNTRLGKTTGRDVDLGKLTYPSLIGLEASRQRAEQLVQEACDALAPFGPRGRRLSELARFIVERDH